MPIVLSSETGRAHLGGSIFCWDRVQRYATSIFHWTYEPMLFPVPPLGRTSVSPLGWIREAIGQGGLRIVQPDES